MIRTTTIIALALAVQATACSKDRGGAPSEVAAAATPGVSAVAQAELGPQRRNERVPVTSSSPAAVQQLLGARALLDEGEPERARALLVAALELDPEFAQAEAYLASFTRGDEGDALAKGALEHAATLGAAERVVVRILAQRRLGDAAQADRLTAELAALVPDDYRAQLWHAKVLLARGEAEASLAAFERASALDPKASEPFNAIAYGRAMAGDLAGAVEAARAYATLAPDDANAHDTLGEMLLARGQLDAALAAFERALALDEGFSFAWDGVAMVRYYRGDLSGAAAAYQSMAEAAAEPRVQRRALENAAWVRCAAGEFDAAFAAMDASLAIATRAELPDAQAHADMQRAEILLFSGRPAKARALIERVLAGLDLGDEAARKTARWASIIALQTQLASDDLAAATRTLARIDQLAAKDREPAFDSAVAFARGALALAADRPDEAIAQLETVGAAVPYGAQAAWLRVEALHRAARSADAAALRERLIAERARNVFTAMMQTRHADG